MKLPQVSARGTAGVSAIRALAASLVLASVGASTFASTQAVRILTPAPEETVHSNAGTVPVVVEGHRAGETLRPVLNGKALAKTHHTSAFELQGVPRGTHRLVVEVLDDKGQLRVRSKSVRFFVWQASRSNPPSTSP